VNGTTDTPPDTPANGTTDTPPENPADGATDSTPGVVLGTRIGPFPGRLDADLVRAYAEATSDPNPGPRAGTAVPPVAVVTQIWEAQQAAFRELVPDAVKSSMTGGVHGEHDVVVHRPIVPGEELQTWVEARGSRRGGRHNLVTMHYSTVDVDGTLVVDQWWTTVLLGAAGDPVGEAAPDHSFPDGARAHAAGVAVVGTDEEMPRRYAEVSSDWSGHHFTAEAARGSGADRPFLHGLCTMALCAHSAVSLVAGGDPEQVRRVAVRFASPAFVGDDVAVHLFDAGNGRYAFEAESNGEAVVRNGWVELRR
jgi:acyl dehydratase